MSGMGLITSNVLSEWSKSSFFARFIIIQTFPQGLLVTYFHSFTDFIIKNNYKKLV